MNPRVPSQENLENIIKYGIYYFPADKHYYSGTVVQCDKCLRSNLRACIGYRNLDLCLSCADQVESRIGRSNPPPIHFNPPAIGTRLRPSPVGQFATLMEDIAARSPLTNRPPTTRMMSSQAFPTIEEESEEDQLLSFMCVD